MAKEQAMEHDLCAGQCLCGYIKIIVSGPPAFSVLCFCQDCQRISGGGHLPQAAFDNSCVEITGSPKTFRWKSDSGNDLQLSYCPDCGSAIHKTTSKMPDTVFVSVGLLNDQTLFQSPHLAFVEGCQDWDAQGR